MSSRDDALHRANETMRRLQHEVRTPIGQIIGYAELIEEELADRGDTELAPDLAKIREAAKRLLDLADGKLALDDDPGAPALPGEPSAGGAEIGLEATTASADTPQAARILVVDDDVRARDIVARRLQKQGFRVEIARDAIDALRRIEEAAPDLVLLEIVMQGMSGLEVLERIRRERSRAELPVILGTALNDPKDAIEGLARGANDYVTKPYDVPVLIARVRAQLEAHRTARQVAQLARQLEFRSAFIRQALGREVSGDQLVELVQRPDAVDLGQERKPVYAVVADLCGSRARAASMSPPDFAALLKSFLDGIADVVAHHRGLVDSVSGDALLALFGLPLTAPDDAARAAACAIAIELEMDRINARNASAHLPAMEIAVGVAAGDVLMIGLGSGDGLKYKALGPPLVDAAVLESAARPGEVWICGHTRRALGEDAVVDKESHVPNGDGSSIHGHRLLGVGGAQLISLRTVPE